MKKYLQPRRRQPLLYVVAALGLTSLAFMAFHGPAELRKPHNAHSFTQPPKPRMWKDYHLTTTEESHFEEMAKLLDRDAGVPETRFIFYSRQRFESMITKFKKGMTGMVYVNVMLAEFDPENSADVPPGWGKKFVFLFAPTDASKVPNLYFLLNPVESSGGPAFTQLDPAIAKRWVQNYATRTKRVLNPTYLDGQDGVNYPPGSPNTSQYLSNTLFARHYLDDLAYLLTEADYQKNANGVVVSGIEVFFSALPSRPTNHNQAYSNRLLPEFEFTQDVNRQHKLFFIDNTPGFQDRDNPQPRFRLEKGMSAQLYHILGFDNGQLCPPKCN